MKSISASITRVLMSAAMLWSKDLAVDSDGDGVSDNVDNCTNVANGDQRDTNGDGFGNACDADLNNDLIINALDLGLLKNAFFAVPGDGSWDPDADLDGDDVVNVIDLAIVKAGFFGAPGPSATMP